MRRLIFPILPLFVGCLFVKQRVNIASCKFSLKSASLESVSLNQFTMRVVIRAYNPNGINAVLDRLLGDISLNDKRVATVENTYKRVIKPESYEDLPVNITVRFSDLGGALETVRAAIQSRSGKLSFVGKAYVDFNIPIVGRMSFSYPVNLSKNLRF